MAWKDPDIEAFRAYWKRRAEARGQVTLAEQRASFDTDMGMIPLAQGCTVEILDLSGIPAEKITPTGAAPDNATASIGTLCWAVRPESVSRFRRCKSARISAACW